MSLIPGYPKGSDITLINTLFIRGKPDATGKWGNDVLTIIFRDNVTNTKHMVEIEDPDNDFYIAKPEFAVDYPQLFEYKDRLDHHICKHKNVLRDIAKETGNSEFYFNNRSNGNNALNQILHTDPRVFFSDMNIEDKYRFYFTKCYTNTPIKVDLCFFDIEADTIHMKGDFPEMGECPVNAVTIIMENCKTIFTLLLRNPDNELANQFEEEYKQGKITEELRSFICENVGGPESFHKYGLDEYKYNILFYDEEINLIVDIFRIMNTYKPDFALAWNMAFDIPYLIARIQVLGHNPVDIMNHPDFKHKTLDYFVDERVKDVYSERGDYFRISSYTTYLDQMIHFASRRKGRSMYTSFSLDFIGGVIAKVNKLDYKAITPYLAQLPLKNYKVFAYYNIFDTIVQHCIEKVVEDIPYVFMKCNQNCTRYNKCHRQTVYLTNRGALEFFDNGFIMGNNSNRGNDPPKTKFPGAFVANPQKLNDFSKLVVNNVSSYIFDNLDDFDFKSLYPSILRQFNIAPNTQIGQLQIDCKVHDKENRIHDNKWIRSGQYMEDLQSHVWLEFGERWFHLAGYGTLYHDVIDYFRNVEMPQYPLQPYSDTGLINPIEFFGEDVKEFKTVCINPTSNLTIPIIFYDEMPMERAKELMNEYSITPNQVFAIKED